MTDSKSTLLYIPDISGFTDFVNNTEINHSRHIISELLEIIIDSNKYGMSVSEIEGDAVLFFKDEIPSVSDLIDQCQLTFKNFHAHLQRYDTECICRCGACETASKLSLKFIIHAGDVEKINIKDHQKLHGSDVILAHRLLKNSIHDKEYILITDKLSVNKNTLLENNYDWVLMEKGKEFYEDLDEINYSIIPLKTLHQQIPEVSAITFPGLSSEKIYFENRIHAPIDLVYENFTNFEKRIEWNEDIKDIIMQGKGLNQSGSIHTCLVGSNSLDIETIGRMENDDRIVYGERLNKFKGLRDIISIFTFEKKEDQTYIKAEVDYKIKSFFGKLLKPMVRKMLQKQTEDGLKKLKKVSEENAG